MSWFNLNGFPISSPGDPSSGLEHGRQCMTEIATDPNSSLAAGQNWSHQGQKFNQNIKGVRGQ